MFQNDDLTEYPSPTNPRHLDGHHGPERHLFHIDILPSHWKFLHFAVRDSHLQYKALPIGLCMVPGVFTKTMVVVAAYLAAGNRDFSLHRLVIVDSQQQFQPSLDFILLLSFLGLQVNFKKSNLVPSPRVQFIGAILDSSAAQAFLLEDRATKLAPLATLVREQDS